MAKRRGTPRPPSKFAELLTNVIAQSKRLKQDFARELKISPAMLSQYLADVYSQPPIELCLRIAAVGGLPPGKVLRAAGRGDMATLLEEVYRVNARFVLTRRERALILGWRSLDDARAHAIECLVLVAAQNAAAPRRYARSR